MENSNAFEAADDSVMAISDESVCDASDSDNSSDDDGGYIESKAPDFDDDSEEDFAGDDGKPVFSDSLMKYIDGITEKEDGDEKKPPQVAKEQPYLPKTAEEEEIDILRSIPSERGRERIKAIIGARHEAESRYRENEGVINGIRGFVEQIGVEPIELAQNLEYTRLIGQGDEASLKVALDMLEEQRDMICKRLNVVRPGIDLLSDFPDLKAAVQRKEITLEHAAKLAKYERNEQANVRQVQEREEYDRNNAQFLGDLDRTKHAITSYLKTRSGEADHAFKVMRLHEHLSRPGVLQEMTHNMDSKRWFSQIRFMYDNIVVPPMRPRQQMQPIRSRPTMQGHVSSKPGASMMEKMGDILDGMGI